MKFGLLSSIITTVGGFCGFKDWLGCLRAWFLMFENMTENSLKTRWLFVGAWISSEFVLEKKEESFWVLIVIEWHRILWNFSLWSLELLDWAARSLSVGFVNSKRLGGAEESSLHEPESESLKYWHTPEISGLELKHHPLREENHLPNFYIWASMLIFQGVDAWYSCHIPCLSAACFKWTNLFHLSPWSWRKSKTNIGKKLRILSRELMFFQKQGKFRKLLKCILSGHIFSTPSKYRERPKCRTPKKQCWNEAFFGLFFFLNDGFWRSLGRKRKGCHCLNQPFFGLEENQWKSMKKRQKNPGH